jgi:hypothetical protein
MSPIVMATQRHGVCCPYERRSWMVLRVLQVIAALGTAATGLAAMLRPQSIGGFTGLKAEGARGVTEIRAALGGFYLALGLLPLLLKERAAYLMLGYTYLLVAGGRAVAMLVDESVDRSNLISLAVEIVFGIVLIL